MVELQALTTHLAFLLDFSVDKHVTAQDFQLKRFGKNMRMRAIKMTEL